MYMSKENKMITPRDTDFAQWYTDVVRVAHLADYSSVKGCIVIEPNGYAIWEKMQEILDKEFKKLGHVNCQMPLLIPEGMLNKEKDLVEGFAPEVAWVTCGGSRELEERLCIRPTSETLFCDYYSKHIKSHRDLPKLYNQWCNVFRWEKETRPFLRSREFLWQEGHTIHATREEALKETNQMMDVYYRFHHDILAIPSIRGKKTEKEKFSGAEYTLTNEDLMYNGVTLQMGTSHYFGQNFTKAYDVKFTNKDNKEEYPYQTSWGITTRMIGALIMVHSDDNGLVLPPKIAPTKVAIIPIGEVSETLDSITTSLKENNISYIVDGSDKSPGFKFAEAEVKGYPVRIEIGARDLEKGIITLVRRDTLEKIEVSVKDNISTKINEIMEIMQRDMYEKALARRDSMLYEASTYEEFKSIAKTKNGFIKINFCGSSTCENKIKDETGLKSRCILEKEKVNNNCIVCGKVAKYRIFFGKQY